MAGTLTVSGMVLDLISGEKVIGPETVTGTATIGQIDDLTLPAGDTTVSVPFGATYVLLVFAPANSVQIKVRTNLNASDVGLLAGPAGWMVFPLPAGTTSLILNAGTGGGAVLEASFI